MVLFNGNSKRPSFGLPVMKRLSIIAAIATLIAIPIKAQVNVSSPSPVTITTVGGNPCQNPAAVLNSLSVTTSGITAVQIIALSGVTKIYICSLSVIGQSGTNPTFSLVQGTGTNCVTGQTVVVPAFATPVNTLFPFANPVSAGVAGNALCYLQTGTTPITKVQLTFIQQ